MLNLVALFKIVFKFQSLFSLTPIQNKHKRCGLKPGNKCIKSRGGGKEEKEKKLNGNKKYISFQRFAKILKKKQKIWVRKGLGKGNGEERGGVKKRCKKECLKHYSCLPFNPTYHFF